MIKKNIFSLQNKTILITGASGLLGSFFAENLAQEGANLALIDIDDKKLKVISNLITERYKVKCKYYVCNISNEEKVRKCIDKIDSNFGEISVLVNNAQGNDSINKFENISLKDWRMTSSVNEEGLFLVTKAVGQKMISNKKGGSIINISSIYGIVAPDHRIYNNIFINGQEMSSAASYSFTKSGMLGLTKYLATYWSKQNIRVNAITPGGIENNQPKKFIKNYSKRVPLDRMGKPKDLIGPVIFLSSDASDYITGQNLIVDGGFSVW